MSGRLSSNIAIETAETVKLETKLRAELTALLADFQYARTEQKAAELEQERLKCEIEDVFAKYRATNALQAGVRLDGFSVKKHVGETTKRLDKKKLIAQGVTVAMLEAAITESPKREYIKVNLPGEKAGEDE